MNKFQKDQMEFTTFYIHEGGETNLIRNSDWAILVDCGGGPGTVIDFKNMKSKKVTFDKDVPQLTTNFNLQPHQIDFFILNKKYIQTEISEDLPLLMRNVNHSLPSQIDFHNMQMFIEKINADYPKQWYAFEQNNRKHVSTTKVFAK